MLKGKMVVSGGLTKSVKRREIKDKGEKERYTHLNAEFQRIARRDKKAFLSDHCKEIEENNRMGKTRDLFKKIRDAKGTFHAKMGIIKNKWYGPNRKSESEVVQSCPTLSEAMEWKPTRLLCLWGFPCKSTGLGCLFLLQGIFLTQE